MAEHGRPYDESGCDLADYSRLPEACEQRAQGMRNDHQCSERQQNMCDVRCFKWHVRTPPPVPTRAGRACKQGGAHATWSYAVSRCRMERRGTAAKAAVGQPARSAVQ